MMLKFSGDSLESVLLKSASVINLEEYKFKLQSEFLVRSMKFGH
jgi:hypothetical protein